MLLQAIREHNVDVSRSVMVGDKLTDMEAARAAGVNTCILVSDTEPTAPADVMRVTRLSSLM
jgi:D-glycero-D-manno-heptose 1,7-bisphosphate phosphatase